MRKETFMLRVENRDMQTKLIREFNDCIEFAANSESSLLLSQSLSRELISPLPLCLFSEPWSPN